MHASHFLQVAAPPGARGRRDLAFRRHSWRVLGLTGAAAAFGGAWFFARLATRPAEQIAAQAQAIEAGTLSAHITAHAEVVEYASLVAVLNAMLGRLRAAFEAQRRFVARRQPRAALTR